MQHLSQSNKQKNMAPAVLQALFTFPIGMGIADYIKNGTDKPINQETTETTRNDIVDGQSENNLFENMAAVDPPLEQYPGSEPDTPVNIIKTDCNHNGVGEPIIQDTTDSVPITETLCPSGLDLRREDHRLDTLKNWPGAKYLDPKPVARNGFYYFGEGDILRCNFCKVEHGDWGMFGGNAVDLKSEHAMWSKDCPFILGKPVGNVPTSDGDEIFCLSAEHRPFNAYYMSKEARLASFRDWPKRMHQTPAQMVEAGFYYSGIGDHAVCFYCGGGLKDWDDNDVPMQEHENWFSRCPFVIAMKKHTRNIPETYQEPAVATTSRNENSAVENVFMEIEDETTKPESEQSTQHKYNHLNKLESTELSEKTKQFVVECKICFNGEANISMIPCGHVSTCGECSLKMTSCPMCRSPVISRMRIFYP